MNMVLIRDNLSAAKSRARVLEAALNGIENAYEHDTVVAMAIHAGELVDAMERIEKQLASYQENPSATV